MTEPGLMGWDDELCGASMNDEEHGAGMMRMMLVLVDINGDGALSREEVQTVHARMFRAIHANSDGQVTPE